VDVDAPETKDEAFEVLVGSAAAASVSVTLANRLHCLYNGRAVFVPLPAEALGAGGLVFLDLDFPRGSKDGIGILVEQTKELDEGIPKKDRPGVGSV
jgi:hypothetical protein